MKQKLRIIVALDFDTQAAALQLVDSLDPALCALKVGSGMFSLLGAPFVKQLIDRGFKVFLDLKFHDIPDQVSRSCKVCADLGVWMLNVHAAGGLAMMREARQALASYGDDRPLLLAVTVLTSLDEQDLISIGVNKPLLDQAKDLALLAQSAGLDGVVCSAYEVEAIKAVCGKGFLAVTPGIRYSINEKNDQKRDISPENAIMKGSDFLVIGRPITQAEDPAGVLTQIHGRVVVL
jgi:orotidine-5'-phosphate decarboxylase